MDAARRRREAAARRAERERLAEERRGETPYLNAERARRRLEREAAARERAEAQSGEVRLQQSRRTPPTLTYDPDEELVAAKELYRRVVTEEIAENAAERERVDADYRAYLERDEADRWGTGN